MNKSIVYTLFEPQEELLKDIVVTTDPDKWVYISTEKHLPFLEPDMGLFPTFRCVCRVRPVFRSPILWRILYAETCPGLLPVGDSDHVTLVPGGAGQQVTISVSSINAMTGMVAVGSWLAQRSSGCNRQQSRWPRDPMRNVTLTAAANAAPGTGTMTLTGAFGMLSHTATVTLTVSAPPPDLSLRYHLRLSRHRWGSGFALTSQQMQSTASTLR